MEGNVVPIRQLVPTSPSDGSDTLRFGPGRLDAGPAVDHEEGWTRINANDRRRARGPLSTLLLCLAGRLPSGRVPDEHYRSCTLIPPGRCGASTPVLGRGSGRPGIYWLSQA